MRRMTSNWFTSLPLPTTFRLTARQALSLAILAALAFSAIIAPRAALADNISGTVIVPFLRVHRSPAVDAPVLGSVNAGDQIVVVGRDAGADWLEAQTAVGTGWVWRPYVAVSPAIMLSSLPISSTAITPYAAVIVYPQINVRGGPSVNYPIIGTLSHGAIITVVGSDVNYIWLQISLANGGTGWIPSEYTFVRGNITALPNTANGIAPVIKVVNYLAPVHSAPDAASSVIGTVRQGQFLPLLGSAHYHQWWKVSGSFGTGYIYWANVLAVGVLGNVPVVSP